MAVRCRSLLTLSVLVTGLAACATQEYQWVPVQHGPRTYTLAADEDLRECRRSAAREVNEELSLLYGPFWREYLWRQRLYGWYPGDPFHRRRYDPFFPFAGPFLGDDLELRADMLRSRIVNQCMRARGYELVPVPEEKTG